MGGGRGKEQEVFPVLPFYILCKSLQNSSDSQNCALKAYEMAKRSQDYWAQDQGCLGFIS